MALLAHYDENTGEILGFYSRDIHGDDIPFPAVEIAAEQWRECLENPGRRRISPEGDVVSCELPPLPLNELVERKRAELSEAWSREITETGMPTGLGFNVDFDILDQQIWLEGVAVLGADVTDVEVWDIGNRPHVVSREEYVRIQGDQKEYYARMLQRKWALRKEVLAAETAAEIEAIQW
ncbi:hypothetical protein KAR29_04725 [Aminithiophilus ramosus]|uniref:DUF4376 domain-containing protein n=1 Tax=Aminithiophilus ramosus TaxID=3029084 RepID=A0A9Q7EWE7_9BACT|nr:hypothetical protein [Aminithiophilus ramosus]QTX33203.1 hypothetical protein KAR29_04725 [Aminithiophilus ramosus]